MKYLKILQYLISVIHIILQVGYFRYWHKLYEVVEKGTRVNPASMANANLTLSQQSFIFLFAAILTLAIYITISTHISNWVLKYELEKNSQ